MDTVHIIPGVAIKPTNATPGYGKDESYDSVNSTLYTINRTKFDISLHQLGATTER